MGGCPLLGFDGEPEPIEEELLIPNEILGKFIGKSGAQINKLRADIQSAVGWVSLKVHTPDMLILRSHLPPGGQHFVELLADNPEKRDVAKSMIVRAIEE